MAKHLNANVDDFDGRENEDVDSFDGRENDHLRDEVSPVERETDTRGTPVVIVPPKRKRHEAPVKDQKYPKYFWDALVAIIILAFALFMAWMIFGSLKSCSSQPAPVAAPSAEIKDESGSGASSSVSKEEEQEAIEHLTVEKLTLEELESLTTKKYKEVSFRLLESSLSNHDKARTEATGFSDALTYGFSAKDDVKRFAELEEEILRNPVYGVTVAEALHNKKVGDKTVESFNPWIKEMIDLTDEYGIVYWLEKADDGKLYVTDEYRGYAATLCTWLERLICQGEQTRQTVENWCLNPAAKNNDRRGIKASYQYNDKAALVLAYIGKNKGSGDESLLVIGFNIHDKRPEFFGDSENPVKTTPTPPTPTPPTPTPPTPNPPTPTPPTPTPPTPDNPGYDKDPNKAPRTNTEPNDDPGPGTSTNNGAGSNTSSADQPTNSTSYDSYQDYRQEVNEMAETNRNQSTGSSPSTPSTPAPSSSTNVDNNGDTGTSTSAPINTPTPVSAPATVAETGEPINSSPGEAWGGPAD